MSGSLSTLQLKNSDQATFAATFQLSAAPGVLYSVSGYNSNAAAQFIQLYDAVALPANGAVPAFNISVPPASNFSIDFGSSGRNFINGIWVGNSSTAPTKTTGAADTQFFGRVGTP